MVDNAVISRPIRTRYQKRMTVKKILAKVLIYFVLLLLYAPLIYITVFSFTTHKTTGMWSGFSFENYTTLFNVNGNKTAQAIWGAAKNTMFVALAAAGISTVIGTLGAIGIFYTKKKWYKNTLEFVNQIPVVNAEIVTAVSLCILFTFTAQLFGIQRSFLTLVIGHAVFSIPYVVMSVQPKLEQMDSALYEAAMDLGATQTQALFKVIIPQIIPGILSGFMLSVTLSLDDYVITAFTKPTTMGFETISTYVDGQTAKGGLPTQLRAFTAILFAVILIVMIGMNVKVALDSRKAKKLYGGEK
ncbi:MAG: ABC transporter permease [Bacilli bacterium]|nr:ABC transporter permease [Bacilli bacterium]